MFSEYVQKIGRGDKVAFVQDQATVMNFSEGNMTFTGNDTDLAIQGKGFFALNTPAGERYTRSGNFRVGIDNKLISLNGDEVLDERREPIILPNSYNEITITKGGAVVVDGTEIAKLGVISFPNEQALNKTQNGMYRYSGPTPDMDKPENTQLLQGALEGSNVNSIAEMTKMIKIQRAFEGTHKLMEQEHERMRRAMQVYGKTGQ